MIPLELTIKQHLESMARQSFDTDGAVSSHLLKLAHDELIALSSKLDTIRGDRDLGIKRIAELTSRLDAALDERAAQAAVIKDLEASNTDLIFERNDAVRRLDSVSKLLAEWRDPQASRTIHRDFAVAVLGKALAGPFPDVNEAGTFTKEAWDSLKSNNNG